MRALAPSIVLVRATHALPGGAPQLGQLTSNATARCGLFLRRGFFAAADGFALGRTWGFAPFFFVVIASR